MISGVVYLLRILKMFHGLMNNPVFSKRFDPNCEVEGVHRFSKNSSNNIKVLGAGRGDMKQGSYRGATIFGSTLQNVFARAT